MLSRAFRSDQGRYEDYDNLYAMYMLNNLAKFRVRVDEADQLPVVDLQETPMP